MGSILIPGARAPHGVSGAGSGRRVRPGVQAPSLPSPLPQLQPKQLSLVFYIRLLIEK